MYMLLACALSTSTQIMSHDYMCAGGGNTTVTPLAIHNNLEVYIVNSSYSLNVDGCYKWIDDIQHLMNGNYSAKAEISNLSGVESCIDELIVISVASVPIDFTVHLD